MQKIFGRGKRIVALEAELAGLQPYSFRSEVVSRVSSLATPDLSSYAETTLYECGRLLSSYQRASDVTVKDTYLSEATNGAEVLHCLLDELNRRRSV